MAGGLADGDDTLPVEILHLSTGKIKVRLFDTAVRLEKFRIFCQSMKLIFIYLGPSLVVFQILGFRKNRDFAHF